MYRHYEPAQMELLKWDESDILTASDGGETVAKINNPNQIEWDKIIK